MRFILEEVFSCSKKAIEAYCGDAVDFISNNTELLHQAPSKHSDFDVRKLLKGCYANEKLILPLPMSSPHVSACFCVLRCILFLQQDVRLVDRRQVTALNIFGKITCIKLLDAFLIARNCCNVCL